MMKLLLCLLISTITFSATHRIVSFNIRELDSTKIKRGNSYYQTKYAAEVIRKLNSSIIGLNEIQFDMPGVPNKDYASNGDNLKFLSNLVYGKDENLSYAFSYSNAGMKAKKNSQGNYDIKPRRYWEVADGVNFGYFPGQYSVGLWSKFKVKNVKVIRDLLWKDFNPNRELSHLKDSLGNKVNKDTVELFGKLLIDVTVEIEGKEVHLIVTHLTPSHGFGKKNHINPVRNLDQLAFLEWYLTGSTYFEVPNSIKVQPLKAKNWIAMGDWNTDYSYDQSKNAKVLRSLFKKVNLWHDQSIVTYEYPGFEYSEDTFQIDYILTSPSVKVIKGGSYFPTAGRIEKGCSDKRPQIDTAKDRMLVSYYTNNKKCWVEVNRDYGVAKLASDHFPVWVDIELN